MAASASYATRIALACAAPLVLVAALMGVLLDYQLRTLSLAAVYDQVDQDIVFFVDELRTLELEMEGKGEVCPPTDIIISASEPGWGPSFHFQKDGCPALGHPDEPNVDTACFAGSCVQKVALNGDQRRVAVRGQALGEAVCRDQSSGSLPGPDGCLYVWRDLQYRDQRITQFRFVLISAFVLASGLAAFLSIYFARRVGGRIAAINQTFASFADGLRTAEVEILGREDEIDALAASVNTALRQIQQDMTASERVNASLSHQLVAPLRRLRDSTRRVLDQLSALEPSDPAPAPLVRQVSISRMFTELEQVETELGHLAKLGEALQDFLSASRKRTVQDLRDTVDLEETCEVTATRFRSKAAQRGITIRVSTAPAEVLFSAAIVDQMLGILIDNAIVYGPSREEVKVSCGETETGAFVTVTDQGSGPPIDVLEDVFAETLSKNSTFSAREGKGGHGIGLLTVRQLAINSHVQFTQTVLNGGGWEARLAWTHPDD